MRKSIFTLIMIVTCMSGSVYARPHAHRMHGAPAHPAHYIHRGHHHHGNLGSFLLGAAVATVVDHIITEAVAPEPVIVERTVVVKEPEAVTETEDILSEDKVIEVPAEAFEKQPAKVVVVKEQPVVIVERPTYHYARPIHRHLSRW